MYVNLLSLTCQQIQQPPGSYIILCTKRVTGIGPATQAWEAWILPLNYTRMARITNKYYIMPACLCHKHFYKHFLSIKKIKNNCNFLTN